MKNKMYDYEEKYYKKGYKLIAGVDEAGRGCLAGPLVVASCILKPDYKNDLINDSKQLSDKKRRILYQEIIDNCIEYKIIEIPAEEAEKQIKDAAKKGMKLALEQLKNKPDIALIDYEQIDTNIKIESIIKGDAKSITIAAASILAKVYRDDLMIELSKQYPLYGFEKHKGYGTEKHLQAIKENGPIKGVHRTSWVPQSYKE